ncbi:hypothetical protein [Leptolyngbya sp. CCY15150]|uniref:hypothetical protein n=1 Tax=Leptolyngbya sp. CCY15150 TaxID=2767772 RepID=UPI00194DD222|nr:hypothetical protein [Leptolyngbya sp. CCY15150]
MSHKKRSPLPTFFSVKAIAPLKTLPRKSDRPFQHSPQEKRSPPLKLFLAKAIAPPSLSQEKRSLRGSPGK